MTRQELVNGKQGGKLIKWQRAPWWRERREVWCDDKTTKFRKGDAESTVEVYDLTTERHHWHGEMETGTFVWRLNESLKRQAYVSYLKRNGMPWNKDREAFVKRMSRRRAPKTFSSQALQLWSERCKCDLNWGPQIVTNTSTGLCFVRHFHLDNNSAL